MDLTLAFFSSPPALPDAPALEVWLFERPLALAGLLCVAAVVVAISTMRAGKTRLAAALGGGLLLLAGAAWLVGALVETDREAMSRRTTELVNAIERGDVRIAEDILAPDLRVVFGATTIPGFGAQQTLRAIESLDRAYSVEELALQELQASVDGAGAGRTQTRIRARQAGGAIAMTWWRFSWRLEDDDQWRIYEMQCLLINGRDPGSGVLQIIRSLGGG